MLTKRLHEMEKRVEEKDREIGWVTHYYQNAKCLISLTVLAIHNYSIQEVIQNIYTGWVKCFEKCLLRTG